MNRRTARKDSVVREALSYTIMLITAIGEIAVKKTIKTWKVIKRNLDIIAIVIVAVVLLFVFLSTLRENIAKSDAKKYESKCDKVYYTYYVEEGDNLYSICKANNPSQWMSTYEYMSSIASENDFPHGNWNKIEVGDAIKLYYFRSKNGGK